METITWKCSECGYTMENEAGNPPPETCPACEKKCEFLNVSCYTPDCGQQGQDPRLG